MKMWARAKMHMATEHRYIRLFRLIRLLCARRHRYFRLFRLFRILSGRPTSRIDCSNENDEASLYPTFRLVRLLCARRHRYFRIFRLFRIYLEDPSQKTLPRDRMFKWERRSTAISDFSGLSDFCARRQWYFRRFRLFRLVLEDPSQGLDLYLYLESRSRFKI